MQRCKALGKRHMIQHCKIFRLLKILNRCRIVLIVTTIVYERVKATALTFKCSESQSCIKKVTITNIFVITTYQYDKVKTLQNGNY